ncbi:MAG: L-2-amino-thiazoline-4-carboxylic acid hydrolase [Vicinamibacterales bacterium]
MTESSIAHSSGSGSTGDPLNAIGVLTRREIEARVLAPVVAALGQEFGRERVVEIVRDVIIDLAREQGEALATTMGRNDLTAFASTLEWWTKDDALELQVHECTPDRLAFDVTRCRYAELYRSLGIPELGAVLSCNRDFSLMDRFNRDVTLTRTRTIMGGAPSCDFRYVRATPSAPEHTERR